MNKLDMAMKILLVLLKKENDYDADGIAGFAFEIADAMQAEADKREPKGFPVAIKESGYQKPQERPFFKETNHSEPQPEVDWQPDWSVAPDWANWWVVTSVGSPCWTDSEPRISDDGNYWCLSRGTNKAPSFNYQGDWKKSLRKRPQ